VKRTVGEHLDWLRGRLETLNRNRHVLPSPNTTKRLAFLAESSALTAYPGEGTRMELAVLIVILFIIGSSIPANHHLTFRR